MDQLMNAYGAARAIAAATGGVGMAAVRLPEEAFHLAALWTELVEGACKVDESHFTPQTCTLVVSRSSLSRRATTLSQRDIAVLEQALLDGVRKSVAADFALCPSSIADILRRSFAFMGLSCWPSRIPLVVVMAAHAKHARGPGHAGRRVAPAQPSRQSVSVARPDLELASELSRAEYAVIRLLVEGKSYEQMAALRDTSKRTVANQLASAFNRLGVSGRAELLCLLAKRQVHSWQSEPSPNSSLRPLTPVATGAASGLVRAAGERR